jgi:alkanesulfonate monooxygenase SsuD/methylene tetrahydromethanopterin reductase-like flavin-dependent oxidoreductase (luciferase family)
VGGEFPKEFEAVGVPIAERGRRTDEAIAILRALWAPGAASFQGRFVQFDNACMEPKPIQPGGPPIIVGGRSERAICRAATLGNGFMPYLYTPAQYAEARQRLRQYGAEAGRDPATLTMPMYQFIYAAEAVQKFLSLL